MSDFEKFVRLQGLNGDFERGSNGQYKSDLLHFMEKAFMHQQAKINEFKKNHAKAILKLDSLNAIINTAENLRDPETSESVCLILDGLMSILRGEHESKHK